MAFEDETPSAERLRNGRGRSGSAILFALVPFALLAYVLAGFIATGPIASESVDAGTEHADGEVAPIGETGPTAGRKRCEFFVVQKILAAREPTVLDQWDINGKRVFEVGFKMAGQSGQSVRLCVYDPENRRALLPAVGDQGQWRRTGSTAADE